MPPDEPLRAGPLLAEAQFAELHRSALLEGCKWDPQVGDHGTLAQFPLLLRRAAWQKLATWAELLTAEALAAEQELLSERPQLVQSLGLPAALCRVLRAPTALTPTAARMMRFDFHLSTQGWRISEANSDVPGGFTEASFFTQRVARHIAGAQLAGDPAAAWAGALARSAGPGGLVALLAAPGYMEDQQIMAFLGRLLREHGCRTRLAAPAQIMWRDGHAQLAGNSGPHAASAIVRFHQAEWLAALPRRSGWPALFRGGRTPVANPGQAALTESKRFPLLWPELKTALPTWQALLPPTCDPRAAPWQSDDAWLLKSALCNTGDTVSVRSLLDKARWDKVARAAAAHPEQWVAQQRFLTVPVQTPLGPLYPCVGVYTLDGRACGAYTRLSRGPIVDFRAIDTALLIED